MARRRARIDREGEHQRRGVREALARASFEGSSPEYAVHVGGEDDDPTGLGRGDRGRRSEAIAGRRRGAE
jgi:hypothetical protein